ncbi:response regulator [Bacillus spongiae]|uniref:Response regulator n=1 Tax=Bacillus spongiae TaxID=2683610 RepID=A0ABU8HBT7_9BACI
MTTVLIVDDAKFMRMTLQNMLIEDGFDIVGEAENGKQAIDLYRELKPDIVTMDITMPEMSGLDALKVILSEFSDAKVIMCSAMGQQKMVVEAIEVGAKDYIIKPFDETRVREAINKLMTK